LNNHAPCGFICGVVVGRRRKKGKISYAVRCATGSGEFSDVWSCWFYEDAAPLVNGTIIQLTVHAMGIGKKKRLSVRFVNNPHRVCRWLNLCTFFRSCLH
jgi:hypothetical protein